MAQDNRTLPQGAGATTATTGTGTTGTATTGSTSFARDEHESGYRSSGRAVVLAERQSTGPSAAVVAGAAVAGALIGGAIPFMFAGRSSTSSSSAGPGRGESSHVEESVVINRPAREIYDFWRNFENLPQFMDNIESVRSLGGDGRRSHWVIKAPAGTSVEFDSFVTEDVPGRTIAWRSEEDASVPNRGRVEFVESSSGATVVRASLSYDPPAGAAGRLVAKLFGREPQQQARQDLDNLKRLLEGQAARA